MGSEKRKAEGKEPWREEWEEGKAAQSYNKISWASSTPPQPRYRSPRTTFSISLLFESKSNVSIFSVILCKKRNTKLKFTIKLDFIYNMEEYCKYFRKKTYLYSYSSCW
jgi:hypothetical protein